MRIFEWFQRLFTGEKKMPAEPPDLRADKAALMEKVLTMLSETREEELTCDEVFAALDQAAELAAMAKAQAITKDALSPPPNFRTGVWGRFVIAKILLDFS